MRPYRAAAAEPAHAPHAALLIDFDNVTMGIRSDLQNQLKRLMNSEIIKGKVSVQRAYADWRRYPQYIVPLSEASIDLIFAPAFGSNKKNATDIRLAIDALEIVFTRPEIGTFILLSGDSDFSSLVLKLKEYGKYVIGVGIRESSSDLLVQNCDEYFGYSELTGLTRESDADHVQRDPWELVVEAVTQMKKDDDVMRSDRLKQVMQSIDAKFEEKDAGFSRFSKFVQEASSRGLLSLEKLDNGQYAVDVGDNANVAPEDEAQVRKAKSGSRSRRKRAPRRRAPAAAEESAGQLTLSEAFETLRQALMALGAVGEEATGSDRARDRMIEILGADSDPVLERARFQRLLRQAHDADLIELVKGDDDSYQLKLTPGAVEAAVEAPAEEAAAQAEAEVEPEKKPARKRARATTRKSTKAAGTTETAKTSKAKKATKSRRKKAADAAEPAEAAEPEAAPDTERPEGRPQPGGKRRNPRYRRGSRSAQPERKADEGEGTSGGAESAEPAEPAPSGSAPRASSGARGLGRRGGRRRGGARRPAAESETAPEARSEPTSKSPRQRDREPAAEARRPESRRPESRRPESRRPESRRPESRRPESRPAPAPRPESPPAESQAAEPPAGGEEDKGIFKRMTAALKKAMEGPGADGE